MLYRRAWSLFARQQRSLALASLLLATNAGLGLLKPWPLALVVDLLTGGPAARHPWMAWLDTRDKTKAIALLALLSFVLHGCQSVLQAAQNALVIRVGLRGLAEARTQLFQKLLRRSFRTQQKAASGDAVYRASWDVYAFQTFLQKGVFGASAAATALVGMVAVMARLDPALTCVALGTVPLLVAAMRWFGPRMTQRSAAAHHADSQVTSVLQHRLSALAIIQAFGQQNHETRAFESKTAEADRARWAQHRFELSYLTLTACLFGLGLAAILGAGAWRVDSGVLTLGGLLVFLAYANQLFEPLNQLSYVGASLADAKASMRRVFDLLDEEEEMKDPPNAGAVVIVREPVQAPVVTPAGSKSVQTRSGLVRLERVSFSYGPGNPVLKDFCAAFAPGRRIAIIGPSGAGKTTVLRLLGRVLDPDEGRVTVDGSDLRTFTLRSWRDHVAVMPQEAVLFPATLRENIAYGRPDAAPDEIEEAARNAFAHEFIARLPEGYHTRIGEGGARLSVGEMQRLCLARAYLKKAPILLMDEPTSALDRESEDLVIESLARSTRGQTVVFVTHGQAMRTLADETLTLR